jgi:TPR repeat protein
LANARSVSADVLDAVKYFKLSANKKNLNGEVLLGVCQSFGTGCCVDRTEAAKEFKMSGDEGSACGQLNYSVFVTGCSQSPADLSEESHLSKCQPTKTFFQGK